MSENGEIYTADNNFTLPPAVTAVTNSTSISPKKLYVQRIPSEMEGTPHYKLLLKLFTTFTLLNCLH